MRELHGTAESASPPPPAGAAGVIPSIGTQIRQRWLRFETPYQASKRDAPRFRSDQVRTVLALTPWIVLANLVNAALVCSALWPTLSHALLLAWSVPMSVLALAVVPAWRTWRQGHWPARNSLRTLAHLAKQSGIQATMWALPSALGYASATEPARRVLLAIAVGMVCAGGFALSSVPRAAFLYVTTLTAGLSVGLLQSPAPSDWMLAALAWVYALIVVAVVDVSARQMGQRMMNEAEITRQKATVDLLLHDFEANAQDWLWELSGQLHLQNASQRLSDLFARPVAELHAVPMMALLQRSLPNATETELAALQVLQRALSQGQTFRKLQVPMGIHGKVYWLALSAKTLLDEQHQPIGWRGVGSDVTRSRQDHAEMLHLANFDALTGLANRHQFMARLSSATAQPFAVLYLDLDDFKATNDMHGDVTGDLALKQVAARLKACIRPRDLLARLGGDEFALISWSEGSAESAEQTARHLLSSLQEPVYVNEVLIQVSACIGIALRALPELSSGELMRHANMALHAAKNVAPNTILVFVPEMEQRAMHRQSMISDLRLAMDQQQLELHFQPLVNLRSGAITGAEALLRWHHPQRGMVPPVEFIPLAEESGLIVEIGYWVMQQACKQAMGWPKPIKVAVNVSALQFKRAGWVDEVLRVLAATGLPPHRLEVEITESLLMEDSSSARTKLDTLRRLGVRVSLDDFGTGYSSLAYLRSFPLDKLKIDASFVRSLDEDESAAAIIQTIIRLAEVLRLDVTAEGVETERQLTLLAQLGSTDAQGYLLSRPIPNADFARLLAHWPVDDIKNRLQPSLNMGLQLSI